MRFEVIQFIKVSYQVFEATGSLFEAVWWVWWIMAVMDLSVQENKDVGRTRDLNATTVAVACNNEQPDPVFCHNVQKQQSPIGFIWQRQGFEG